MSHESRSPNTSPDLRSEGELRMFRGANPEEGRIDKIFKAPGTRFSLAELVDHFASDPVSQDVGSIAVQTVGFDGKPQTIYMDMSHAVPEAQPWLVALLDRFPLTDSVHDITVGQPWHSPFGTTGPVHGVAVPYTHGYTDDMYTEAPEGKVSPTALGRQLIDQALEQ